MTQGSSSSNPAGGQGGSKVDLSTATDEELNQIKNEVLRKIAERVRPGGGQTELRYDRHGSAHSKHSG